MRTTIQKPHSPLPNPLEINHFSGVSIDCAPVLSAQKVIPATVSGYGFAGKCIVSSVRGKCGVLTPCPNPLSQAA